jgi:restriction system protein
MTNAEMEDAVATAMELSDELRAVPRGEGPRTQFDYELSWVRSYLKMVGALDNNAGVWRLTALGAAMSDADIAAVPRRVREMERQRRLQRRAEEQTLGDGEVTEVRWKDKLLAALLSIPPPAFERLCQLILRESGFTKVEVTGRSGDGGIDGAGILRLNLLSFHVRFQSKRFKDSVGAAVVRDFRGAMVGRADKGLIMTTGTFTPEARREAIRDGASPIDLIDGDVLCDLLKQLKIGVATRMIEEVEVDPAHFQAM